MKPNRIRPALVGLFALLAVLLPFLTGNIYYLHVATVIGVCWPNSSTSNVPRLVVNWMMALTSVSLKIVGMLKTEFGVVPDVPGVTWKFVTGADTVGAVSRMTVNVAVRVWLAASVEVTAVSGNGTRGSRGPGSVDGRASSRVGRLSV